MTLEDREAPHRTEFVRFRPGSLPVEFATRSLPTGRERYIS